MVKLQINRFDWLGETNSHVVRSIPHADLYAANERTELRRRYYDSGENHRGLNVRIYLRKISPRLIIE